MRRSQMKFLKRYGLWIGIVVMLAGGAVIVWNPFGLATFGFLGILGVIFQLISDPAPSAVKCH